MRRLAAFVAICLVWTISLSVQAAEFHLTNGEIVRGEPSSFTDDGLVVRLDLGGFSPRIGWGKLTQETLKQLAEIPEARPFVEPYIEVPPEVKEREREKRREIHVREPERVELPEGEPGFFASLGNPLGLFILGVLYLGNLYAGLEVARFRGRSVPLVVGVSAILPILGPIIFALMPAADRPAYEAPPEAAPEETQAAAPAAAGAAGGLGLAAAQGGKSAAAANPAYGQVYTRQNTSFDRRFFETKFTGFFRVVPADAEKDLVLVVKGAKAEYIAKRISRISASEMHMQLQRGNEVSIPFGEVVEVSVRHKDAKA